MELERLPRSFIDWRKWAASCQNVSEHRLLRMVDRNLFCECQTHGHLEAVQRTLACRCRWRTPHSEVADGAESMNSGIEFMHPSDERMKSAEVDDPARNRRHARASGQFQRRVPAMGTWFSVAIRTAFRGHPNKPFGEIACGHSASRRRLSSHEASAGKKKCPRLPWKIGICASLASRKVTRPLRRFATLFQVHLPLCHARVAAVACQWIMQVSRSSKSF